MRALPARRLVENGLELLLARVEGRQPNVAVRTPLLARMNDPVGLVEALGRPGPHVRGALLVVVEPRDVGGLKVDLGLALHHPLRHRPAMPGPSFTHTAAADQSPPTSRRLAQDGQAVGRDQQAVDGVLDAHRLVAHDLRHQLERVPHLLHEVVLVKGSSVGESAASSIDGISSGSCSIGRWA